MADAAVAYGIDVSRVRDNDPSAWVGLYFNLERAELRHANRVRKAVDAALKVRMLGGRYTEDWFVAAETDPQRGAYHHHQHQVDEDRIAQQQQQEAETPYSL